MVTASANIETLLSKLQNVKQLKPGQWQACCPAHASKGKHSLSVTLVSNKILLKCFAGCDTIEILRAIDLNYKDLFLDDKPDVIEVERYRYTDEAGKLLFYTIRYLPKDFRQCHPGPDGELIWNLEGVHRVLYRLPDVLTAMRYGETIIVAEGEKDVDNLWLKAVRPASCNPMGAGKWNDSYTQSLKGADIVIIPDNDQPGYNHAKMVAGSLYGNVKRLRILTIPEPFKDFSDWMENIEKWDNNGFLDYDCELIPEEFNKLLEAAKDYTSDFKFPSLKKQFSFKGVTV